MPALRRVIRLAISPDELVWRRRRGLERNRLTGSSGHASRWATAPTRRRQPWGMRVGVTHHKVHRCLMRAARLGVLASLDDSPRSGKAPAITPEARAWLVSLACRKACDLGYPHGSWTTRLLARHARAHAVSAGHPSLCSVVQGTVCKLLAGGEVKPHKVRYDVERRDQAFESKMAEVLCVYREVAILKRNEPPGDDVAIIFYDEKPGIQAIGTTAPDLRRQPGRHKGFARDHHTNATARSACWPASTC